MPLNISAKRVFLFKASYKKLQHFYRAPDIRNILDKTDFLSDTGYLRINSILSIGDKKEIISMIAVDRKN